MSLSGAAAEFCLGKVSFKELSVIGSRVYTPEHFREGVNMLEAIAGSMNLDPLVSDILPLEQAQEAVDMMRSGRNSGKILIDCR